MTTLLILAALALALGVVGYMWRHRGEMVGHRLHPWQEPDHDSPIPYVLCPETEQRLGVWLFETGGFE